MEYIDLHVHSNVSDGTSTPSELVAYAYEKKLKAFALTDHDTVDGVGEAIAAAKSLATDSYEVEVVPGVEISAAYRGRDIHILGLYVDYTDETLVSALHEVAAERRRRNEKMLKKLQDNLYNFVKDRYSLAEICKQRVEFYKSIVNKE